MSQATTKAPQIDPQASKPAPAPQLPKTGVEEWLRTWRQVLIAEVLSLMEFRRDS